ncbi:SH3 domain-containing protein [Anabaena lutea]|uniref:SH3 domain-containing protein n=1 Tax=Anabaena lutea FACHB-196 TaxID=2692881 RepID=A0ABR8FC49_9NOST|nr:SH3 domain-containing protein [Anabaena lutea]MBD2567793.1 SH3 domain-containing protein [Anabaena lutea FACHB-196]
MGPTGSQLIAGLISATAAVSTIPAPAMAQMSMPWGGGKTFPVTQTVHKDGWIPNAMDFGLRAGEPVLAPIDSTVKRVCATGVNRDHHAILFSSSQGDYSLIHVKTSGIFNGRAFKKGEQIGVVAADLPKDPNCAISYGQHLHVGFPSVNSVVDGYRIGDLRLNQQVTSQNGRTATPPPSSNIRLVNFTATAAPQGVNIRSAPSLSASIVGRIAPNQRINFDAWTYGDAVTDIWLGRPDRRWYRIAGTNNWVASAVVNGNAPGSQP